MPLIQGGPGWASALSGIANAASQYIGAKNQQAQQQAAAERQAAIDKQNAALVALTIAGKTGDLQSQGRDAQGNMLPDPYTPKPVTVPGPGIPSPSLNFQGQPIGPDAPGPDVQQPGVPNLGDHIAALIAAGQVKRAEPFQTQQTNQQAQLHNNLDFQSKGYAPDGTRLPDPYTPPAPTMVPGPGLPSPSKNFQGQSIGPPAPGPMVPQAPSLKDQASQLHQHAIALTLAGQTVPGAALGQQADALDKAASAADESTVRFLNAATEKQKADAQINHWSTSDSEKAKNDAQRVAVEIRNGNLSFDAAMAHVGATYAGINQGHEDRTAAATQAQKNWIATHNPDGSTKGTASKINPFSVEVPTNNNPDFKDLPQAISGTVRGLVSRHGMTDTVSALTKIANGAPSPKLTQTQAKQALTVLNGQ